MVFQIAPCEKFHWCLMKGDNYFRCLTSISLINTSLNELYFFCCSVSWCWVIFHLGSSVTPSTHFAVLLFNQLFLILYLFIWFLLPLLSTSHLPLLNVLAWFKAVYSIHQDRSEFWKNLSKHSQPSPALAPSALSFLWAESLVRILNRPGFRTDP